MPVAETTRLHGATPMFSDIELSVPRQHAIGITVKNTRHFHLLILLLTAGFSGDRGVAQEAIPPNNASEIIFNQSSHDSRGFGVDAARVDSQITLSIPAGQAPAVYAYLRATYADSNDMLQKAFPELPLRGLKTTDVSLFTDEYYDTPKLDLYQRQNTTRYRIRVNTTDPADRKSGRELVQIKVTPTGAFEMRSELKFEVNPSTKRRDPDDFHPLIRLIDRDQRQDFKDAMQSLGLNALSLRHILTNSQQRSRVYINWGKAGLLSFSVDEFHSRILWASASLASVDIGLVENEFTAADEAKRKAMREIRDLMIRDLKQRFPELTQTKKEKYGLLLDQLLPQIPFLRFLFEHGVM